MLDLEPVFPVDVAVMSDGTSAVVFLDASQQAIVKSTANALRTSGSLAVVDWIEHP